MATRLDEQQDVVPSLASLVAVLSETSLLTQFGRISLRPRTLIQSMLQLKPTCVGAKDRPQPNACYTSWWMTVWLCLSRMEAVD